MIRNAVTALSPAVLRVMYFYLDVFTLKQIQYDDTVAAMGVYSTWLRAISLPESLRHFIPGEEGLPGVEHFRVT